MTIRRRQMCSLTFIAMLLLASLRVVEPLRITAAAAAAVAADSPTYEGLRHHQRRNEQEEESNRTCGEIFTASSGNFKSPGFPVYYPANCQCRWTIRAKRGEIIRLEILDFDIEKNPNVEFCSYDYIKISNLRGAKPNKRYCNLAKHTKLYSDGNLIDVFFASDKSQQRPGFWIAFFAVKDEKAIDYSSAPTVVVPPTTTTASTTTTSTPVSTTTIRPPSSKKDRSKQHEVSPTRTRTTTPATTTRKPSTSKRPRSTTTTRVPPITTTTTREFARKAESDRLRHGGGAWEEEKSFDTWLIAVVVVIGSSVVFFLMTALCLFVADHRHK